MSRSRILLIAALGAVAVLARGLLPNASDTAPPTPDPRPPSEPASVAAPATGMPETAGAPTPSRDAARGPEDPFAAAPNAAKALEAAAALRHRADFPPTSRPIEDNIDPIVRTRAVKERLSPPGQGRKPTLVVFSSALSYEAPSPIILFAKFIREYPGDWAPRADAEIAGELRNVDGALVAEVELNDDGQERDIEAGDGVFTVRLTPAAEDLERWNGLIRVKLWGETADGERRSATTRFYYGAPSAKLTGYYRDQLVNGHLQLEAEIEVKEVGEYRLEATLSGARGLLAWAENTVALAPGVTLVPLTFWGLALREANEPGPYRLSSIALANVTYKPPQLNDAIGTAYLTAPYDPDAFSGERYGDPKLIERANRYEERARRGAADAR
ncbi:MAG: hypothetical protein IT294_02820 [Deltaproteobacteria bacterium]|nr:hypothetical protein [Deltaproteobacteria bacterium]